MGVTRDDVAKLAGVSPATVSYVINNGPRPVSEETRQKVLWAIEQLDYRPSVIARSLKTNKTYSVGIVVSDILNPILASMAKSAVDLLSQQNYSLTICNTDESAERERDWLRVLLERRVDGMILLPTGANRSLLHSLVDAGQRIVLIDRQLEGLNADAVVFDNETGAYEAVSHLASLGHSRIGMINLPTSLTPGRGRLAGYKRALRDAGVSLRPELIREGSFKEEGFALAEEILDQRPVPTALFAASNGLARGVLQQVKLRGLRMPDDLAFCVFDDVAYYSYITPSITAVSYDVNAFVKQAVQFLVERIAGAQVTEARTALVPCKLRVRESTAGWAAYSPPGIDSAP